uniref:Uncharacterized protein n=1 Tax=Cacopsylla melanoneura TaxID=428564 RepID=A0A8D8LJ78_9HEMI
MKAVSFAVLSIFFLAQFSDAASIVTGVIDDVNSIVDDIIGTVEAVLNRAVNLRIKVESGEVESLLKNVQVSLGDTLELSGLTKEDDEVETIVVRQQGGLITFVLKRVLGLVFKVVEIVPSLLNTLVSGVPTKLTLLNRTGGPVQVDVASVTELVLKTVDNTGESVTSLVLSLVPNSV